MAERNEPERIDPGRSMRLLWGLELGGRRGPKPSLNLDDIVSTAVEIADEEGLDAVSMRRIAERLGVGAMTLYSYVPTKSDLLDLMVDRIAGEQVKSFDEGADWRTSLEMIARGQWEMCQRHHWVVHLTWTRAPMGPNMLDAYESAMSVVAVLGVSSREMSEILMLLSSYVFGAARLAVDAVTIPSTTSMDDAEWWARVDPVLEAVWDPARFPTLSRPEMATAWAQPDDERGFFFAEAVSAFEFGLARVLDGIEAFVERRRP
jgi:AcrR family transcriptional regulator